MEQLLKRYLKKFKNLRLDRSSGVAPHKPILLISVILSFQNGQIASNKIFISPEIVALFNTIWSKLVTTNHQCQISLPFYYLKSDGFWKLKPKANFNDINAMGTIMKSFSKLKAVVDFAELPDDLVELLNNKQSRNILLEFLLDEYFPYTKDRFIIPNKNSLFDSQKMEFLKVDSESYKKKMKQLLDENQEEEIYLRGAVFKREIPKIYNYRCCISGMQVTTIQNFSMIDACHIVPFSSSYNDTVTNGIALCPNLHRAFDRGLITINSNYRVEVSDMFSEQGNYSIKDYKGVKIELPLDQKYWPSLESLSWHKREKYLS